MRGADERQAVLFSYRSIEERIPADHPLRAMRRLVDPLLVELSPRFQALYSSIGRPSIPPEQLLRALLGGARAPPRGGGGGCGGVSKKTPPPPPGGNAGGGFWGGARKGGAAK